MTSTPVNDVSAISMYKAAKGVAKGTKDQTDELAGSFQDAMNQAKSSQADVVGKASGKNAASGSMTRVSDSKAGVSAKNETSTDKTDKAAQDKETKDVANSKKTDEAKPEKEVEETDDAAEKVLMNLIK